MLNPPSTPSIKHRPFNWRLTGLLRISPPLPPWKQRWPSVGHANSPFAREHGLPARLRDPYWATVKGHSARLSCPPIDLTPQLRRVRHGQQNIPPPLSQTRKEARKSIHDRVLSTIFRMIMAEYCPRFTELRITHLGDTELKKSNES